MTDALTDRAQLEARIELLEAKNLELRRTIEELRASIHAKDLLLRTSGPPVHDATHVAWDQYYSRRVNASGQDE
jgi:hypothetical protein